MTSPSPTRPKLALRVREWFWRADALRAARQRHSERRRQALYHQRARIAAEVGELTLDPPGPWLAGSATHIAAALFVEAIGWSLRVASADESPDNSDDPRPATTAELAALATAQGSLLLAAAGDPNVAARVVQHLQERRFEESSRSAADGEQAARELAKVARSLLRATPEPEDELDKLYFQRLLRTGLCALFLLAALVGAIAGRDAMERRNDLALGKPWVASSTYETVCTSPSHSCEGSRSYFFHTRDEKHPWLEIDLQSTQTISKVRVINRLDCCAERAVPLRIEVSTDHTHWQEVARKSEPFDDWTGHFSASQARWVRLRVIGSSFLHLSDVRVLK